MGALTENDTFRSNQIREGLMTREKAWRLAWEENEPRMEAMHGYFDALGVDKQRALDIVRKQPTPRDLILNRKCGK